MSSPRIKVLAKAARLLEVLAEFPDSTPASLAQRLGEPRPTVYRLIQDLALLGYLEEGPDLVPTASALNCSGWARSSG